MRSRTSHAASGLAGAFLMLATAASVAAPLDYLGLQAPKNPLSSAAPPNLGSDILTKLGAFQQGVNILGRNEFEGGSGNTYGATAGTGNFSYTGGTATLSGGGVVVGAAASPQSAGRYNMTTGVAIDPQFGAATGHWLEATSSFTYTFSSFISAISFYGTDFGDVQGTISLTLFSGNTQIYTSGAIKNSLVDPVNLRPNGNLVFLGVKSDVGFDKAVFTITQSSSASSVDVIGFDSIVVGNFVSVPEPTSLALVGLALVGAGLTTSRRSRA